MKDQQAIKQTWQWYLGLTALLNFSMSLHFAIYATFLLSRGLSLLEINLVNVFFYVTLFLFEIPTGAFADVFGRKHSVVLAGVFNAAGTLVYFLAKGFWGFGAAESLLAIGSTFLSGAFTAWAIDRLKHFGHEADLKQLFTRQNQIIQITIIAGGLMGSYIAVKNLSLTWLLSSILFVLWTLLAAFGLKEEYFTRKKFSWSEGLSALKATTTNSINFGLKHKTVRFILLVGSLQYLCIVPMNMQWQPWFNQFFTSVSQNGWLWVAMSVVMFFGASFAPKFLKLIKNEALALTWTQIIIGLTMAGTAATGLLPISLAVFMANEWMRGLFRPIKDAYLNDQLPARERSTIISFEAIAHHIGGAAGLALSGLAALRLGIPATWLIFGVPLAVGSLLIYRFSGKGLAIK